MKTFVFILLSFAILYSAGVSIYYARNKEYCGSIIIAETDIVTAITVQAATNFLGCYIGMYVTEKILND